VDLVFFQVRFVVAIPLTQAINRQKLLGQLADVLDPMLCHPSGQFMTPEWVVSEESVLRPGEICLFAPNLAELP
jgi:hypothetical protein